MAGADITGRLAAYMVKARELSLPPEAEVMREAKHRILDTLAAMVSGAHLKAGEMAIRFMREQGGVPEATVLTTDIRTSAVNAALANGMFAHADETDDFEPVTKAHPGCAIVPAALAMAERAEEIIRRVNALEQLDDVRELRPFLTRQAHHH
jgi:2-methylcitrate dehydratase PrpD